ncbi:unnamed protein product [Urochloa humidicola]
MSIYGSSAATTGGSDDEEGSVAEGSDVGRCAGPWWTTEGPGATCAPGPGRACGQAPTPGSARGSCWSSPHRAVLGLTHPASCLLLDDLLEDLTIEVTNEKQGFIRPP